MMVFSNFDFANLIKLYAIKAAAFFINFLKYSL